MSTDDQHPWQNPNKASPTTPRKLWAAYLLWLPFGFFVGAHRVYLDDHRNASYWFGLVALIFLSNWFLGFDNQFALLPSVVLWIWWIADLFQLPGMVRRFNAALALKGDSSL